MLNQAFVLSCLVFGLSSAMRQVAVESIDVKASLGSVEQRSFPCKLSKEDVTLTDDSPGFKLLVLCTEEVTGGALHIDGAPDASTDGKRTFEAAFKANTQTSIGVFRKERFGDAVMHFSAVANGIRGESNKVKATDKLAVLPCELYKRDVVLTGDEAGFEVTVMCTNKITNPTLYKTGFTSTTYEDLPLFKKFKLATFSKSQLGDAEIKLVGESRGKRGVSNVIRGTDPDSEPEEVLGPLPCKLIKDDVKLVGGEPGFTLKVECTEFVMEPALRIKGFNDKTFENIMPLSTIKLITYSKETVGDRPMQFVGKVAGQMEKGGSNIVHADDADVIEELDSIPCKLTKKDVKLQGGGDGVEFFIKCTKSASEAVLEIPGSSDAHYDYISAGKKTSLKIYAKEDIGDVAVRFVAICGGITGTSNVVKPSDPDETLPQSLPCTLTAKNINVVGDNGNEDGFNLFVECSESTSKPVLKISGLEDRAYGTFDAAANLKLTTLFASQVRGRQAYVRGEASGEEGKSNTVTFD